VGLLVLRSVVKTIVRRWSCEAPLRGPPGSVRPLDWRTDPPRSRGGWTGPARMQASGP